MPGIEREKIMEYKKLVDCLDDLRKGAKCSRSGWSDGFIVFKDDKVMASCDGDLEDLYEYALTPDDMLANDWFVTNKLILSEDEFGYLAAIYYIAKLDPTKVHALQIIPYGNIRFMTELDGECLLEAKANMFDRYDLFDNLPDTDFLLKYAVVDHPLHHGNCQEPFVNLLINYLANAKKGK